MTKAEQNFRKTTRDCLKAGGCVWCFDQMKRWKEAGEIDPFSDELLSSNQFGRPRRSQKRGQGMRK